MILQHCRLVRGSALARGLSSLAVRFRAAGRTPGQRRPGLGPGGSLSLRLGAAFRLNLILQLEHELELGRNEPPLQNMGRGVSLQGHL